MTRATENWVIRTCTLELTLLHQHYTHTLGQPVDVGRQMAEISLNWHLCDRSRKRKIYKKIYIKCHMSNLKWEVSLTVLTFDIKMNFKSYYTIHK